MAITPERIAALIALAPDRALANLTGGSEHLRAEARRELAEHVYGALFQPIFVERAQMALPL